MGSLPLSTEAESFLSLKSREDLAVWLGISDRRLRFLLYRIPSAGKYTTFQVRKRGGGHRTIEAPSRALKQIQRKLLKVLTEIAPASGIAKGFVRGRSIVDHAKIHRGARWVVLADIKDFFPSINFGRVRGAFTARPFSLPPEVSTCLAQICCKDGALPQGAPTSPVLANLICRPLDRALVRIAKANKCCVSRYADDICISTNLSNIPESIAVPSEGAGFDCGTALLDAISSSGFELNKRKFRVANRSVRQLVTGLVVNRGVSISREWRRQVRVMLHLTRRVGTDSALEIVSGWERPALRNTGAASMKQFLRGKINYSHYIDLVGRRKFTSSLYRSYPTLRYLMPELAEPVSMRVMTEGATDLLHIEAALRAFQSKGEFKELRPRFRNFSGDSGDAELMETLLRIARSDVHELTIGVFDCDNAEFLRRRGLEIGSFLRLGEKVYAACLAPPEWLSEPFCIESLYQRSDATKMTAEGRRLFFGDEFDSNTGLDSTGSYLREYPKKKAVVLSDKVTRQVDGFSVLLSKMDFASMVHSSSEPFESMDFSGFGPTLQLLREIARHMRD